ncbi:MAG: hypothetical protein KDC67_01745, partial [Ignavibacteriae bacterium]|nr:hypothetical protein [Ignavibacteriota bacterium]
MQPSIKKIGTILIVIVLLPLVIFTFYELSKLSDNEKVIEDIYSEQLNTIIFSVNQYTDDIVQGWTRKIGELNSVKNPDSSKNNLENFCKLNSAISLIIIADTLFSDNIKFYSSKRTSASPQAITRIQKILINNIGLIDDLIKYKKQGYSKVQSLVNEIDETPLLSFLIYDSNGQIRIG